MLTRYQRLLAFLLFLRRPLRGFLPILSAFCAVLLLGGLAFHLLYTEVPLSYVRALYITYSLVFMEHLLPFPHSGLLQLLYFVLPPLGLVVILDGLMRFGVHVLRRDPGGREWNQAMCQTMRDHVILCGLGKAGLRTLQYLVRLGQQVCVLEKNPDCPNLAFARLNGVPVLVASGREEGIFDQLNTAAAKSIILATDDDLANIEMALDARKANPKIHVALRVFDQELASKIRHSFDIPVAVSTTALAAPLFATASSDPSIVNAFEVGERLLVVACITVAASSALDGMTLGALAAPENLWVLEHRRGDVQTFCPEPDIVLARGDQVTLQTEPEVLSRVHAQNRPATAPAA